MKILLYGVNFSPELTGIGKYTGEMAQWLSEHGHEVRVVTAPPYYPEWKVDQGYSSTSYKRENISNVDVWRCPIYVPEKPSGLKRILHLASFALSSLPVMLRQVFWQPDVVWVVEPPFFCAPGAWLTARLSGTKAWLHIQDYEVDAAFDLGLLKGDRLKRIVLALERWMLRRFEVVSTISNRMLERALNKGVIQEKVVLFPNWVDIKAINPAPSNNTYRSELGIEPEQVVALYSGNMGAKQGLGVLAELAREHKASDSITFVFCGNGAGRAELEEKCGGLSNVLFLDLQPVERLGELLTMADIHLLPQRADAADLVMPSKLTGMLASGRPVVATAHDGTELANVVDGCGLVVPPEDVKALSDAVGELAADAELRSELGKKARLYAEEHIDMDAVLGRFERDLLRLKK